MNVRDALRIFTIIGRANGHSSGVYDELRKLLGLSSYRDLGDSLVNEVRDKIGTIRYIEVQDNVEDAFFKKQPVLIELNKKRDELELLQLEIEQLKSKLVN